MSPNVRHTAASQVPSPWRSTLMLAMGATGCLSLSPLGPGRPLCGRGRGSRRCAPRPGGPPLLSQDRDRSDDVRGWGEDVASPGWVPALLVASCLLGGTAPAGALDTTTPLAPQMETSGMDAGRVATMDESYAAARSSLGDSARTFLRRSAFQSEASPRRVTWTQLPSTMTSSQSMASSEEAPLIVKKIETTTVEAPNDAKQADASRMAPEGIADVAAESPSDAQGMVSRPVAPERPAEIPNDGKGPPSESEPSQPTISQGEASSQKPKKTALQATSVEKIAEENKIAVELLCDDNDRPGSAPTTSVQIDRETFQKIKVYQPPLLRYLPPAVQPWASRQFQSMQVLEDIPDNQLFLASVVAGSLLEMIRTSVLYPLSTVKVRVQARKSESTDKERRPWEQFGAAWRTTFEEITRGDLYAGIVPSLLITVPASGVYAGMKEVSRRELARAARFLAVQHLLPDDAAAAALVVSLLAAFIADVAALAVRTPGDVLALRLQVFGEVNVRSDLSNWAKDSVALLRPMVLTDVPFLLGRIFLTAAVTTGGENLGRYEFETVAIACVCAFLTTPFDVARTRILLPAPLAGDEATGDAEPRATSDGGVRRLVAPSRYREERRQKLSVLRTMKAITKEGNGGVQNLYAGWFERTAFLGVGRAWLDPLRVIGYLGLRDALLLKLFD